MNRGKRGWGVVGAGWLVLIKSVRGLERWLSVPILYRLAIPFINARVAFKRHRPSVPYPSCIATGPRFRISRERRRGYYLAAILELFPDRLSTAKWQSRVQIDGLEFLTSAREQKRPVILAFCHFGPYNLLRFWLRAAGFPAATLIQGEAEDRSTFKRLKDELSPFPEIPVALYQDQLRDVMEFVQRGYPLLVAVDMRVGKQVQVSVDDRWDVTMATGAIRMAIRQNAELIPCCITDGRHWNFRIKLGPPVPSELLSSEKLPLIGKHLIDAVLPEFRAYPDRCADSLIKLFQPAASVKTVVNEISHSDQLAAR